MREVRARAAHHRPAGCGGEKAAVERIRAVHDLLTPKGIKYLRESLGSPTAQLADLCSDAEGIGNGWEGEYLQNREGRRAAAQSRCFRNAARPRGEGRRDAPSSADAATGAGSAAPGREGAGIALIETDSLTRRYGAVVALDA